MILMPSTKINNSAVQTSQRAQIGFFPSFNIKFSFEVLVNHRLLCKKLNALHILQGETNCIFIPRYCPR